MARKIIGIKVCYYLIKIFLHNKIHFKINTIICCIRVYIYKVITVVITRYLTNNGRYNDYLHIYN